MDRRYFLAQTGLATSAALLFSACGEPGYPRPDEKGPAIGLQLYTVRDEISKGIETLLEKIAAMGYTHIEMYGYDDKRSFFGKSVKEMDNLMRKNNLLTPSGHVYNASFITEGKDDLWKVACEDAAIMGHKYIVLPWLEESIRPKDAAGFTKLIDLLNRAGKISKEAGLQFAYHNHDFEFEYNWSTKSSLYDTILQQTDPETVKLELDLFWAVKAGADPVSLFFQNPGRFPLWHVKDLDPISGKNADVGSGSIDFKTIFENKSESGMKYFFLEQENYSVSPIESIQNGISYIKKDLIV